MLVVALIAWSGCAAEDAGMAVKSTGYSHQCDGDSDCGTGMVCHTTWPICIASEPTATGIAVTLTPSADGMATAHLDNIEVVATNQSHLVLPKTVHIKGRIRVENNVIEPSISATLVAVAMDPIIPGLHLRTQTTADDTGYDLALIAGVAYTVAITVQDTVRPVHRISMLHNASLNNVDIELPDFDAYPKITGRVFRLTDEWKQPVKGVHVTGKRTGDAQQCTTGLTDKLGAYVMYCPLTVGAYTIHLGPMQDGPIVPSFQAQWPDKDQLVIDGDRELPDILIPHDGVTLTANIRVQDPDGNPVSSVPVTVTQTLSDSDYCQNALFRAVGVSDADGMVQVDVSTGPHRVTAVPHPTSGWAIATVDNALLGPDDVYSLTLTPKVVLTGTVVSHKGTLQAGARVATRLEWTNPDTGIATQQEYTTKTGLKGQFSLPVDTGSHQITVTPPHPAALPRWTSPSALTIDKTGASLAIELPFPILMEGTIRTPQGKTAGLVAVRAYDTVNGTHALANTTSDQDGHYHLILPSPESTGL